MAWPLNTTPGIWLAERVIVMADDEGDREGARGRKAEEADSEKCGIAAAVAVGVLWPSLTLTCPIPTVSGLTSTLSVFTLCRLRLRPSSLSPPSLSSSVEADCVSQRCSAERCRLNEVGAGTSGEREGESEWPELGEEREEAYELGE